MKVKFKKMHPDAKIPVKHYDDDFVMTYMLLHAKR